MKSGTYDWQKIEADLDLNGSAKLESLLDQDECAALINGFAEEGLYRRHIIMERYGYGQGEYKYFAYPLPDKVLELRQEFYPPLSKIANKWAERLSTGMHYPDNLADYTARCHAAGQERPTPLILKYKKGDYNRLHQDLYGEHLFPLQMVVMLNTPGRDFDGGEFILTEQRPRQQSRARVIALNKGDAIIFAVNHRPIQGKPRFARVTMRHGVSDVHRGQRHTLGIIFHDAK